MKDIDVLIEALPYIKKFHEKKILIKYGGHAMVDDEAKASTARDTVFLKYIGMKLSENERANTSRLMKVKDMILKKAVK